jgi:hypothetical protein
MAADRREKGRRQVGIEMAAGGREKVSGWKGKGMAAGRR